MFKIKIVHNTSFPTPVLTFPSCPYYSDDIDFHTVVPKVSFDIVKKYFVILSHSLLIVIFNDCIIVQQIIIPNDILSGYFYVFLMIVCIL
jgi:hypothetical protein